MIAEVDEAIRGVSPLPSNLTRSLIDAQELESDLQIASLPRGSLATPFQRIARTHNRQSAEPTVGREECKKLKTVKDARSLVAKKAGFTVVFACLCLLPCDASAEDFWGRTHLRQNLNVKKEVPQPAFLQITDPDGERRSYAVGLGLRYDAVDRPLVWVGPFAEYLRNNLIDKEQDFLKAGAVVEWQFRPIDTTDPERPARSSGVLLSTFNFANDEVKDTESVQASVTYMRFWVGPVTRPRPNHRFLFGSPEKPSLVFLYSPNLGIEFEEVFEAEEAEREGTIVRGLLDLSVALYPWSAALDDRLELSVRGAHREDLSDDTSEVDDSHPIWSAGLTYYFLKMSSPTRLAGISLSYTDGEDPTKGFEQQQFWQVALKVQID